MAKEIFELEVTIGSETRKVEFVLYNGYNAAYSSKEVGLFRKRTGTGKTWKRSITAWKQTDGSFKISYVATILNRSGYRLIGWADDKATSQHLSA